MKYFDIVKRIKANFFSDLNIVKKVFPEKYFCVYLV